MIGCVRKVNHQKFESKTITCRDYRNYDPKALNEMLKAANWESVYKSNDFNKAWFAFEETLSNAFDTRDYSTLV